MKVLWGRAAGRCALPNCRMEVFVEATEHDPMVIIGEIAHIEASSNSGPRANANKSKKDRDDYENLILLCSNCHLRLDGQKNSNSVESIKKLKQDHEEWVRLSLPERGQSTTGWQAICIQGVHTVDFQTIDAALAPDFAAARMLLVTNPTQQSWDEIEAYLRDAVRGLFGQERDTFDQRFAVFPLGPVSSCIALGYLISSRPHTSLFQFHRDDNTWQWNPAASPADDISVVGIPDTVCEEYGDIAFRFRLSADVTDGQLKALKVPFIGCIDITVSSPSTGWLQHPQQLKYLARHTRISMEKCRQAFPNAKCWHLFYAGPAPGGVCIGRQANPTMSPPLQLYEFNHATEPQYSPSMRLA
jgi:hypothetical protein